jgi:D-alanyl-lipoteichoic acid acyltransferase DltB (MBOAT superfamily)
MRFNSIPYALFLPTVLALHWGLPKRFRLPVLLVASYIFYGAWDWRFAGLLLLTTVVDYSVALGIAGTHTQASRRRYLLVSLGTNLTVLGFFKYAGFFVDSAGGLLHRAGLGSDTSILHIVLPIGISFYTFVSIAYVVDVYRGKIPAVRNPLLYATFVSFFPQLVAGPIERASMLVPQLMADRKPPGRSQIESGLSLILLGLVKKVVIADQLAPIVDRTFRHPQSVGSLGLVIGVVAFTFQIYADFSGYIDIARGSSRLLSVELMHNFREPYLSRSITEFWRRWHISLSTWLRDYVYIPLGGNREGGGRTYVNLMATMLLGGLWHGASWHFVVWGGLHGCYLVVERIRRVGHDITDALPHTPGQFAATVWTFGLVALAWVFFRAPSLSDAGQVLRGIVAFRGPPPVAEDLWLVLIAAIALFTIDVFRRSSPVSTTALFRRPAVLGALAGLGVVAVLVASGTAGVPFIYFQF